MLQLTANLFHNRTGGGKSLPNSFCFPASSNLSKVYDESEIENIIQSFEDMDEEEYESAPSELKAIYITYGLESRRKRLHDKIG